MSSRPFSAELSARHPATVLRCALTESSESADGDHAVGVAHAPSPSEEEVAGPLRRKTGFWTSLQQLVVTAVSLPPSDSPDGRSSPSSPRSIPTVEVVSRSTIASPQLDPALEEKASLLDSAPAAAASTHLVVAVPDSEHTGGGSTVRPPPVNTSMVSPPVTDQPRSTPASWDRMDSRYFTPFFTKQTKPSVADSGIEHP